MIAADSGGNSKGQKRPVKIKDAGTESAKAALAAVTGAINAQKVLSLTTD